uniref:Uncharacterized protein n=1 Tax=Cucumis melo TaxID=3656 RepID=A0A9I9EJ88_CUCME
GSLQLLRIENKLYEHLNEERVEINNESTAQNSCVTQVIEQPRNRHSKGAEETNKMHSRPIPQNDIEQILSAFWFTILRVRKPWTYHISSTRSHTLAHNKLYVLSSLFSLIQLFPPSGLLLLSLDQLQFTISFFFLPLQLQSFSLLSFFYPSPILL